MLKFEHFWQCVTWNLPRSPLFRFLHTPLSTVVMLTRPQGTKPIKVKAKVNSKPMSRPRFTVQRSLTPFRRSWEPMPLTSADDVRSPCLLQNVILTVRAIPVLWSNDWQLWNGGEYRCRLTAGLVWLAFSTRCRPIESTHRHIRTNRTFIDWNVAAEVSRRDTCYWHN